VCAISRKNAHVQAIIIIVTDEIYIKPGYKKQVRRKDNTVQDVQTFHWHGIALPGNDSHANKKQIVYR